MYITSGRTRTPPYESLPRVSAIGPAVPSRPATPPRLACRRCAMADRVPRPAHWGAHPYAAFASAGAATGGGGAGACPCVPPAPPRQRRLSRSRRARPNIWRLRLCNRLLCPSSGPVRQGRGTPALTAASSSSRPVAQRRLASTPLVGARGPQASSGVGCRWRTRGAKSGARAMASATSAACAWRWVSGGASAAGRLVSRRSPRQVAHRGVRGWPGGAATPGGAWRGPRCPGARPWAGRRRRAAAATRA